MPIPPQELMAPAPNLIKMSDINPPPAVAIKVAFGIISQNLDTCSGYRNQLESLQSWITGQQQIYPSN